MRLQGFSGAAGRIRTADLILTNRFGALQALLCKTFRHFLTQKGSHAPPGQTTHQPLPQGQYNTPMAKNEVQIVDCAQFRPAAALHYKSPVQYKTEPDFCSWCFSCVCFCLTRVRPLQVVSSPVFALGQFAAHPSAILSGKDI